MLSSNTLKKVAIGSTATLGGLYLLAKTQTDDVYRDSSKIWSLLKIQRQAYAYGQKPVWSIVDLFQDALNKGPERIFIKYITDDDRTISYTYRQIDECSNQVANFLHTSGIGHKSIVALIMNNCPEFIMFVLGVAKVGGVCAMINTKLQGTSLMHCLNISNAKLFLVGSDLVQQVTDARNSEKFVNLPWFVSGNINEPGFTSFDSTVATHPTTLLNGLPCPNRRGLDTFTYIYTSGTTGLPKATMINHIRCFSVGYSFSKSTAMVPEDIIYTTLPLFHSAAFLIGLFAVINTPCTMVLRSKFSASKFWKDCARENCTIFQYIGEMCNYLLLTKEVPEEKTHKLRGAIGNGLRPSVWRQFQDRFNIPNIYEFYGATEGAIGIINNTNEVGCVGFFPPLVKNLIRAAILIKYDVEKDQPVRDENGFCIRCNDNEVGHLITELSFGDPITEYKGYTDLRATEKKFLKDVFKKGDVYFMSGDLMKQCQGKYYFVDRIGDTFRWKGENVATSEVEGVIRKYPGVYEVNVYGVTVADVPGRAGMAAILVDQSKLNFQDLYKYLRENLPEFAIPIFIRLTKELEVTGTYKHKKFNLQQEGFNPSIISDSLYLINHEKQTYVPLTNDIYESIETKKISKL